MKNFWTNGIRWFMKVLMELFYEYTRKLECYKGDAECKLVTEVDVFLDLLNG